MFKSKAKAVNSSSNTVSVSTTDFPASGVFKKRTAEKHSFSSSTISGSPDTALVFYKGVLESILTCVGLDPLQILQGFAQIDFLLTAAQHDKLRNQIVLHPKDTVLLHQIRTKIDALLEGQGFQSAAVMLQKHVRGWLVRKRMKNYTKQQLSITRIRNAQVLELMKAERSYLAQLELLQNQFLEPIQNAQIKGLEVGSVHYLKTNLKALMICHQDLLAELENAKNTFSYPIIAGVGEAFCKFKDKLEANYIFYSANYQITVETLNYLCCNVPRFITLLEDLHPGKNALETMQSLYTSVLDYLKSSVKRLKAIRLCSIEGSEDAAILDQSIDMLEKLNELCSSKIFEHLPFPKHAKQLLNIEWSLEGIPKPLCLLKSSNRRLIREGNVRVAGRKHAYVYLLNDMCIVGEKSEKTSTSIKFARMIYFHEACLIQDGAQPLKLTLQASYDSSSEEREIFTFRSKDEHTAWREPMQTIIDAYDNQRVFGVPLQSVIQRENPISYVPRIIEYSMDFLLTNGLQAEGIFRVPGDTSVVNDFKRLFDGGEQNINFQTCTVHDIATLLKLYLRQLPEPLFPFSVYTQLIQIQSGYESKPDLPEYLLSLAKMVVNMEFYSRTVLYKLLQFLLSVSAHEQVTKMGIPNLALVFAPNLIRPEIDNVNTAMQSPGIIRMTEMLIEHHVKIWQIASSMLTPSGVPIDTPPEPLRAPNSPVATEIVSPRSVSELLLDDDRLRKAGEDIKLRKKRHNVKVSPRSTDGTMMSLDLDNLHEIESGGPLSAKKSARKRSKKTGSEQLPVSPRGAKGMTAKAAKVLLSPEQQRRSKSKSDKKKKRETPFTESDKVVLETSSEGQLLEAVEDTCTKDESS